MVAGTIPETGLLEQKKGKKKKIMMNRESLVPACIRVEGKKIL